MRAPGDREDTGPTGIGTSTIRYASGRYQRGVITALVQYAGADRMGPILVSMSDPNR